MFWIQVCLNFKFDIPVVIWIGKRATEQWQKWWLKANATTKWIFVGNSYTTLYFTKNWECFPLKKSLFMKLGASISNGNKTLFLEKTQKVSKGLFVFN